jgi:hypothetical protein
MKNTRTNKKKSKSKKASGEPLTVLKKTLRRRGYGMRSRLVAVKIDENGHYVSYEPVTDWVKR